MNRTRTPFLTWLAISLFSCSLAVAEEPCPDQDNPYPTATKVDYVIGCMASNGQTPEILKKCSCSIDFIAASLPYDEYEKIETLLRLQQMPGVGRNAAYKHANWSKETVTKLREIQAESTLRCF